MKGKEKCRILKEIRQRIADENGIEYVTSECKHKGDCRGTCPKCESELRYIERELEKKRRVGTTVAVAGIAASLIVSTTSCTPPEIVDLQGDVPYVESETTEGLLPEPDSDVEVVEPMGDLVIDDECEDDTLMGEPETEDVPYIDENGNEALNPELPEISGALPETFFPEDPDEYEGYSAEFISECLAGMSIEDIKAAWGEEDMNQERDGRGVIAYFSDTRDIVIQYDVETLTVINATVMENA